MRAVLNRIRRSWLLWRADRVERRADELACAAATAEWKAESLNHLKAARDLREKAARLRALAEEATSR